MIWDAEAVEIVACALRPAGSWGRFASLLAFVVATAWVARSRRAPKRVSVRSESELGPVSEPSALER